MKCLVATFGWTEQFVLSSILKYGVTSGDEIILLIPDKKDEKSEIILRDFESFIKKYIEGIELRIVKISLESFEAAVREIAGILKGIVSRSPEKLIVNLSGGMRALILATYTALQLLPPVNVNVELETEDRSKCYHIPNISLKTLIKIDHIGKSILAMLRDQSLTTKQLLKEFNIPRSTLYKRLKELEMKGLIELRRKGKMLQASITPLGAIFSTAITSDE